jgi:hypothetical protein
MIPDGAIYYGVPPFSTVQFLHVCTGLHYPPDTLSCLGIRSRARCDPYPGRHVLIGSNSASTEKITSQRHRRVSRGHPPDIIKVAIAYQASQFA